MEIISVSVFGIMLLDYLWLLEVAFIQDGDVSWNGSLVQAIALEKTVPHLKRSVSCLELFLCYHCVNSLTVFYMLYKMFGHDLAWLNALGFSTEC